MNGKSMPDSIDAAIAAAHQQPQVEMMQFQGQLPSGLPFMVAVPSHLTVDDALALVDIVRTVHTQVVAKDRTARIVLPSVRVRAT
jgi:hypothetical protein